MRDGDVVPELDVEHRVGEVNKIGHEPSAELVVLPGFGDRGGLETL